MYVLICMSAKYRGAYGARSGARHSYTRDLAAARRWGSVEAAREDACGNEVVRRLDEIACKAGAAQ